MLCFYFCRTWFINVLGKCVMAEHIVCFRITMFDFSGFYDIVVYAFQIILSGIILESFKFSCCVETDMYTFAGLFIGLC